MELLEGESLGTRLRQNGALPIATALDFAYQTASALGAAHAKGIVHRDLKPDNLFVVPDPHDATRERIKVLDFGIAKLQQGSVADSVKTRTGTLMGTPIYMSPEQCRGTRAVDHRSDIYSLGVIFYEMLVGQPPFVSEGFGELVNMHLNVPPASARSKRRDDPAGAGRAGAEDARQEPRRSLRGDDRGAGRAEGVGRQPVHGARVVARSGEDAARRAAAGRRRSPMARHDVFDRVGERLETELVRRARRARKVIARRRWPRRRSGRASSGGRAEVGAGAADDVPTAPTTVRRRAAGRTTGRRHHRPRRTPPLSPPPWRRRRRRSRCGSRRYPAGAKVVDDADGALLGMTPLVLTRPRGGTLTLRFEKDGYSASTRTMSLDGDRAFELTLEQKPRKRERKPRAASRARAVDQRAGEAAEVRPVSMVRQGARVSLILAFVFPAIICAAVALAYYGYRYAVASSVRSKASLMEGNQQLAQLLAGQVQDRIDRVDGELFEEVEWDDPATDPPSSFELPAGVESVVVLDDGLRIRSVVPVPDPAQAAARAGSLGRATSGA